MCGASATDLHVLEKLQRVVDLAGVPRGDVLAFAQVRAHGEEHGVEPARRLLGHQVVHLVIEDDLDAQRRDPGDFGVEHLAREAVLRNAEMHHAAGQRPRFPDHDGMTAPRQVPRHREPARAGADDEHALARGGRVRRDRPAFRNGHVAEKPLDGMDAHRLVHLGAITRVFARVIADAPVHRRHGVVADDDLPGLAIAAGLRLGQPGLDVFAGRARVIARRQAVDVERPHRAHRRHAVASSGCLGFGGHGRHPSCCASQYGAVIPHGQVSTCRDRRTRWRLRDESGDPRGAAGL